jgi:hypothetical protein
MSEITLLSAKENLNAHKNGVKQLFLFFKSNKF